jgi:hypothetical protein
LYCFVQAASSAEPEERQAELMFVHESLWAALVCGSYARNGRA